MAGVEFRFTYFLLLDPGYTSLSPPTLPLASEFATGDRLDE